MLYIHNNKIYLTNLINFFLNKYGIINPKGVINMLDKIIPTCRFVVDNVNHIKINYDKIKELIDELLVFDMLILF